MWNNKLIIFLTISSALASSPSTKSAFSKLSEIEQTCYTIAQNARTSNPQDYSVFLKYYKAGYAADFIAPPLPISAEDGEDPSTRALDESTKKALLEKKRKAIKDQRLKSNQESQKQRKIQRQEMRRKAKEEKEKKRKADRRAKIKIREKKKNEIKMANEKKRDAKNGSPIKTKGSKSQPVGKLECPSPIGGYAGTSLVTILLSSGATIGALRFYLKRFK